MARAFIAVQPPPVVLDAIEARVGSVPMPGARRPPREQWHLTVQFLGNDADVDAVAGALEREPLDAGPGRLRLSGAGALRGRRRGRLLVLSLYEGAEWMHEVCMQVERRLAPLGYARDDRDQEFLPHLTLARFREPTDVRAMSAAVGAEPFDPAWTADEVVLFESTLGSERAVHRECARIPTGS